MTRKEIGHEASMLAAEVDGLPTFHSKPIVELRLVSIVRATLEDAARAVCEWCAKGGEPPCLVDGYSKRYHGTKHGAECCAASKIHDLIAKLEKEGEGE